LALERPHLIKSLTLIEPTCFSLLKDMGGEAADALAEINGIGAAFFSAAAGVRRFAIARFVDYWNGAGAWAALRGEQQDALTLKSAQVRRDFEALSGERLHLGAVRRLAMPTLIVTGTTSPRPALLVAEGLRRGAPRASLISLAGAGHMLPMTHAPQLTALLCHRLMAQGGRDLRAA
jgi:pimeloyl-ACP methyl ester carboxylesterase